MLNSNIIPPPAPFGIVAPLKVTVKHRNRTSRVWRHRTEVEEFSLEHDLDKPFLDLTSGGSFSMATDDPPAATKPLNIEKLVKDKKSIRMVAEEHRKRMILTAATRRRIKLWVEEVASMQPRGNPNAFLPDFPRKESTAPRWVRGELIKRGTYGDVYLGMNATSGEMMAVRQAKISPEDNTETSFQNTAVVQALELEVEILKDLDHPNIVQYLGFEETASHLNIFFEYVGGGSIGSRLSKYGRFEEEVTKSFTAQILDGLEYLHSKDILLRDLKADDILVEVSGVCKISAFGTSKWRQDSGAAIAMPRNVFWMSPEAVSPQDRPYSSKVDIWSVGCVILEMWTGMRPWHGEELTEVLFKLSKTKLPPPVPEYIVLSELGNDFMTKCFASDPEERPTAAELRKHEYLELAPGWVFTRFG